jgi:hypothetical protein
MKTNFGSTKQWKLALLTVLTITACKQAGYQVLNPSSLQPNNFDGPTSSAPTARVEVIDRGVSVTWIYVGTSVDIRPTGDTVDADYVGKDKCENPGIIAADYDLGATKPSVKRTACSTLASTGQVFATAGEFIIKMIVKSQDNEQSEASMTLRVLERSVPKDQIEGGFTIHAKPMLVALNQAITFTGICELKGRLTLSWDFADKANGVGAVTQHGYAALGSYLVKSTCSSDTGKKSVASLTVVVMNNPPAIPEVPVPVPGNNPNLPTTPNCDPTQGPCQTAGQVPVGSKVIPDSSVPIWYYDPYCACYSPE